MSNTNSDLVEDLSTDLSKLTTRGNNHKKSNPKDTRNSSSRPLFESMIQPQWHVNAKPFQMRTHGHLPSVDKSLLFVVPDCKDDCPVCLLVLPNFDQCHYFACCGKVICLGCLKGLLNEHNERNKEKKNKSNKLPLCPFCRVPIETSRKERASRMHDRVYAKQDDSNALAILGFWYSEGKHNIVPQDTNHGISLLMRAIKLGSADACASLGDAYNPLLVESGLYPGVERNLFQSIHYYQIAAMKGHVKSRFQLAILNTRFFFDISITFKHFQIAASQGLDEALNCVQIGYMMGNVTKDEFEDTLRANYKSKQAVNSIQRKEALEFWTRQSKQHDAVDISFTLRSQNL